MSIWTDADWFRFENGNLPELPTIYCSYCWQSHRSPSVDWWIENNVRGCGADRWRYFTSKPDYMAYVKHYRANECQHAPMDIKTPEQLTFFNRGMDICVIIK